MRLHRGTPANVSSSDPAPRLDQSRITASLVRNNAACLMDTERSHGDNVCSTIEKEKLKYQNFANHNKTLFVQQFSKDSVV